MAGDVRRLVERRRNRVIGNVLGVSDELVRPHVPPEAADALRKVLLDEVNDFAEVVLALLDALDRDSQELNALWLERLERIERIADTLREAV